MEPNEIKVQLTEWGYVVVEILEQSKRQMLLCTASSLSTAERIAASLRLTAHLATEWIPRATVSIEKGL